MHPNHDELDAITGFFDLCADKGEMSRFEADQEEKVLRFLEDWNIQPGHRVLEPGCGSGRLTALLAEAVGAEGEVLGLDISPRMVEEARKRGIADQARVQEGSVYQIPREDNTFDHVLCFCVFPHLTRPAEALAEIARVLKTGGSLWVNHLEGSASLNRFHTDTSSVVSSHHLPSESEMRRLVENAGFEIKRFEDTVDAYILQAVKR